jgi:GxxExxY protein
MALEHEELTGKIIAAAIEVHRRLGPGFLESIYENALEIALKQAGIKVARQVEISIQFDGIEIGKHRLDLLVQDTIVVELKAIKSLEDIHFAVVKSYLRAANLEHGLILNFSKPTIEVKRVICH